MEPAHHFSQGIQISATARTTSGVGSREPGERSSFTTIGGAIKKSPHVATRWALCPMRIHTYHFISSIIPAKRARSILRPLWTRDFAVPTETSIANAASS